MTKDNRFDEARRKAREIFDNMTDEQFINHLLDAGFSIQRGNGKLIIEDDEFAKLTEQLREKDQYINVLERIVNAYGYEEGYYPHVAGMTKEEVAQIGDDIYQRNLAVRSIESSPVGTIVETHEPTEAGDKPFTLADELSKPKNAWIFMKSSIATELKRGRIYVNGVVVKDPNYVLNKGDTVLHGRPNIDCASWTFEE